MKTIIKIAWLNIWRNKLRSSVVFISIILGIWAGLIMLSLSMGLNDQRTKSIIENQISHIQIHSNAYLEDEKPEFNIENYKDINNALDGIEEITHYSNRLILNATITTAHGFNNIQLIGVDPEIEAQVTTISAKVDTGTYFNKYKNNPIVIGKSLADDLKIDVKKSANIAFQDATGNFVTYGFRIEGIFNTSDTRFDKSVVFMKRENLEALAFMPDMIHEIAIMCTNIEESEKVAETINASFNNIKADHWKETSPQLGYADDMMGSVIAIFLGIIIFALSFGILNTMLMAVLERKREIGVLMSVGMNRKKIFLMIMLETLFLAVIAAPLGLGISYATITYFGTYGLDLSVVGEGMNSFGAESMLYTSLDGSVYWLMALMIGMAAILSSIIPAKRALNYDPAEAVRSI